MLLHMKLDTSFKTTNRGMLSIVNDHVFIVLLQTQHLYTFQDWFKYGNSLLGNGNINRALGFIWI